VRCKSEPLLNWFLQGAMTIERAEAAAEAATDGVRDSQRLFCENSQRHQRCLYRGSR